MVKSDFVNVMLRHIFKVLDTFQKVYVCSDEVSKSLTTSEIFGWIRISFLEQLSY